MGRPSTHSAYVGWLSCCPHASVKRGGAKRYGATWCVGSSSNPTALVHRPRRSVPMRQNPNATGGGRGRLTGAQARVGEAVERRSRRRRTSWYRQLLLGGLPSLAPFFSQGGGAPRKIPQ